MAAGKIRVVPGDVKTKQPTKGRAAGCGMLTAAQCSVVPANIGSDLVLVISQSAVGVARHRFERPAQRRAFVRLPVLNSMWPAGRWVMPGIRR